MENTKETEIRCSECGEHMRVLHAPATLTAVAVYVCEKCQRTVYALPKTGVIDNSWSAGGGGNKDFFCPATDEPVEIQFTMAKEDA